MIPTSTTGNAGKQAEVNGQDILMDRDSAGAVRTLNAIETEPINILLVDDEPKNLVALETVLDDPGYRLVRPNPPTRRCWRW